jgi:ATP-binding cassette subfamily B protein
VPQEPFLFSASIADNVALVPAPSRRRLSTSRRAAWRRLDKDVEDFPAGFETVVGRSAASRCRAVRSSVPPSRALSSVDPRILVLDDAAVGGGYLHRRGDPAPAGEVMRQRTSIIVSHRISTVKACGPDRRPEHGRVAERGRHADLVRLNGLYCRAFIAGLLEEELEAS